MAGAPRVDGERGLRRRRGGLVTTWAAAARRPLRGVALGALGLATLAWTPYLESTALTLSLGWTSAHDGRTEGAPSAGFTGHGTPILPFRAHRAEVSLEAAHRVGAGASGCLVTGGLAAGLGAAHQLYYNELPQAEGNREVDLAAFAALGWAWPRSGFALGFRLESMDYQRRIWSEGFDWGVHASAWWGWRNGVYLFGNTDRASNYLSPAAVGLGFLAATWRVEAGGAFPGRHIDVGPVATAQFAVRGLRAWWGIGAWYNAGVHDHYPGSRQTSGSLQLVVTADGP